MHRVEAFHQVLDRARATRGVALMGVCNVTPDSFSDGGRYLAPEAARARVDEILAEGADLVDIGGESTRPGALAVPATEQMDRVLGAVRHAVSRGACVSIDTTSPEVAARALDAGACAVNDASCLRERGIATVVASAGAALVLMHTRGTPADMAEFGRYPDGGYKDVVGDVCAEWELAAAEAHALGVPRQALVMDPGFGFAKNARQSLELMVRLREVVARASVPVAVGASRKSFLTAVDPGAAPMDRLGASIAAAVHVAEHGAAIVRVHDVRATRQAIDLSRRLRPAVSVAVGEG
ncbi:MAG: dihydropteroate synthase [Polyangiaceae bacterium]|nr:dihydropteroate synthase [Polyangiaceae bacterium]